MVKELDFFQKQIETNVIKARNGGIVLTNFLDETKQALITSLNINDISVSFDGGFDNAEYKRALFMPKNLLDVYKINVYEIAYNKKFLNPTHRMILGTLMSLGIKRESIGDIAFIDDKVYFACTKEIAPYLLENFKLIGHVAVTLKEVRQRLAIHKEIKEVECIVASMRLDVILAEAYHLSRSQAQDLILEGLVSINHLVCLNQHQQLKVGDVLSVRHKGRVYFLDIGLKTRSDKFKIKLGFIK